GGTPWHVPFFECQHAAEEWALESGAHGTEGVLLLECVCACRRHLRCPLPRRGPRHVPLERAARGEATPLRCVCGGSQRWIFRLPRNPRRLLATARAFARLGSSDAGRCSIARDSGQNKQQEATKESMSDRRSELTVSLWRGAQQGRYETYKVPWRENQTVLDVVTFVQRHLDPTLSYRFACRVGMCGSCAMTVKGTPRWPCRTHVASVAKGGRLEIGPLANLPVIKDLAADMRPFFDKWQRAKGAFVPSQTRNDEIERIRPDSAARIAADAAIECINCGICYAACDTVRWNSDYLGPAALNRAWTLVNDVRDAGNAERLQAVAASGG